MVVKGSIQRQGEGVHLTVNLINTKTLRQVGSVEMEDAAGDISTLQNEVVTRLAKMMGVSVTSEMSVEGISSVPAAYESYLKALGYIQRYDKPGNLDAAIDALQSAVNRDVRFAVGYAALGEAYRLKYQVDRNLKWLDEATKNCKRAKRRLDSKLPSVYVTLGRIHDDAGKHDLAVQEFQHALDLNPRDADALNGMAHAYENASRIADAEAAYKKATALRLDYWDGYNTIGLFYDRQRRYDEAIKSLQRAIELTPDNAQVSARLSCLLDTSDKKMIPNAERALRKSLELNPSFAAYANLGFLYTQQGKYAESGRYDGEGASVQRQGVICMG